MKTLKALLAILSTMHCAFVESCAFTIFAGTMLRSAHMIFAHSVAFVALGAPFPLVQIAKWVAKWASWLAELAFAYIRFASRRDSVIFSKNVVPDEHMKPVIAAVAHLELVMQAILPFGRNSIRTCAFIATTLTFVNMKAIQATVTRTAVGGTAVCRWLATRTCARFGDALVKVHVEARVTRLTDLTAVCRAHLLIDRLAIGALTLLVTAFARTGEV